jgi:hypothetical protein
MISPCALNRALKAPQLERAPGGECKRWRSQFLALKRAESFLLALGETDSRKLRSFQALGSFQSSVTSTLGVPAATGLATGGWRRRRESAGAGIGEWRDSAAVQSDQRRGAAAVRRRPEP